MAGSDADRGILGALGGQYVGVGLTWPSWRGSGEESEGPGIRETHGLDRYQVVGMLCLLALLDDLLRESAGHGSRSGGGWLRGKGK